MSYKDIVAGEKTAKPIGIRFVKSPNKGTHGIEVMFEFKEKEVQERLSWTGWLSSAALPYTMKTLVEVLKFNGNDAFNDNTGELTDPQAIDFNAEVKLVVEMEEFDGKVRPKIKYVNSLSGGSGFGAPDTTTLRAELGALGFKGAFLAAKQSAGQLTKTAAPAAKEEDIEYPPQQQAAASGKKLPF